MASLSGYFQDALGIEGDERTKDWVLVQRFWTVDVVFALYMTGFLACKYLRNRRGRALWNHVDVHGDHMPWYVWAVDINNHVLSPLNWWIAARMSFAMTKLGYNALCTPAKSQVCSEGHTSLRLIGWVKYGSEESDACKLNEFVRSYEDLVLECMWLFYISKFLELSDTLILMMGNSMNRGWELHLLHHGGLFVLSWYALSYFPGGTPAILVTVNCYAHAISYTGMLIRNYFDLGHEDKIRIARITRFFVKAHFVVISAFCGIACFIECGLPKVLLIAVGVFTFTLYITDR